MALRTNPIRWIHIHTGDTHIQDPLQLQLQNTEGGGDSGLHVIYIEGA